MRKIKEVLRLKYAQELSERQIARSCGISRPTVAQYLMRARAAGLGWPLPAELDDASIEARLFPVLGKTERGQAPMPDFEQIHRELQSHKHLTLQLVWQEYKEKHPDGFQYSQFCELHRKWAKKLDLVLRGSHRAGEKLFVDYAGQTVPVVDAKTGEVTQANIFVAVLGASSYTYAEATLKVDLESWIGSHVRALEYIGGCPEVLVPDNLKDGVKLPCRYEPELNPTYQEMAAHYNVAVIPARVRKPRDKAKAEAGVLLVERWILAAVRKQTFLDIGELNQAIRELLDKLNSRPFRKMTGSRLKMFEQIDRPALSPLPACRYTFARWKWARVTNDYHVELERHYYSVPSELVGRKVEIRYTADTVEVLHNGMRVASHARSDEVGGATTIEGHRPESHRRYLEWDLERLLSWAANAGPSTKALAEQVSSSGVHRDQVLRSCLGIKRLGDSYGVQRLEAACARALNLNACSYKSVASILKSGLDRIAQLDPASVPDPVLHDNIRGADYFDPSQEVGHVN
jgi:transposase